MNNTTNQTVSRRETLAKAGVLGAGAAAFLLSARTGSAQPATGMAAAPASKMMAPVGDLNTAQFALSLERLQAAFYAQVLTAQQGRTYLPPRAFEVTQKIAGAKVEHVTALEGVLTGAGQTLPGPVNYQFPAQVFVSPITYAWFAYTLEEIGIGAYLGAVGNIESDAIRQAAASIYGAKAQHAALLRSFSGFDYAPRYYEAPLTTEQVTQLLTPYMMA